MAERSEVQSGGITPLGWYMASQCMWFFASGIQFVAFPGVVAILLREGPTRTGLAQAAMMLPAIIFMLPGGMVADRMENRALLVRLLAVSSLAPMIMAAMIFDGSYSYSAAIIYAVAMGTVSAFTIPARDGFLMSIAGSGEVQRAIGMALMLQFIGMLAGMGVAGLLPGGLGMLFVIQAGILLVGMVTTGRINVRTVPTPHAERGHPMADILDGLRVARQHPAILPVLIGMGGIGVFYVGPFMVIIPLLVRDFYGMGVGAIALINTCFWSGTIVVSMLFLRHGQVKRSGRLLAIGLSSGTVILGLISIPSPFWVLSGLVFLWGIGAGISMTMSRTVVQENAPDKYRARLMSIYNLGFMGGGPMGALGIGLIAGQVGLHNSIYYSIGGMVCLLILLLSLTNLWHIRANPAGAGI